MYPSYLSLSATCKDPDEEELFAADTGFLDIQSLLCWSGKLVTSIIRKEQKLPFQVVQYVHLESNRPVHACYNVLINLVLAVVWHCNTSGDFLAQIRHLVKVFMHHGFQRRMLVKVVSKTLHGRDFSAVKLDYDPAAF